MIIKRRHTNLYAVVSNALLNDQSLSFEARGVAAMLMSKPEDWDIRIEFVMEAGNIGRNKALRIMKELKDAGYLVHDQDRENGKFLKGEYTLCDFPQGMIPSASPEFSLPQSQNQTPAIYNKELQSKEYTNTPTKREYPKEFNEFWESYPQPGRKNASKVEAIVEWNKLSRDEKSLVLKSLPRYGAYCAGNRWYHPLHPYRYLKSRRFEAFKDTPEITEGRNETGGGVLWVHRKDTPQFLAWMKYQRDKSPTIYRKMADLAPSAVWCFRSEWPPTEEMIR